MSDIMRPISFGQLMNQAMEEYARSGSLFGVADPVKHTGGQALPIFEEKIEAPFGPAAGPHTQLAQNIIAAYAAGARFFELKTVQQMDGPELAACVNKPCITAGDECYNCEWSTELYVHQAFAEYVKAWVACKLLAKEYGLGDPDAFVFNMSVGYDLKGIQSEKIDAFIEGMKEAKDTGAFRECIAWAEENISRFRHVDAAWVRGISSRISASITESTLHGCPPEEIERIATYLLTEKHLNTYIKLNPTLLGYDYARERLDSLGFDYVSFDDRHFREDLQWKDAVPMLERLTALAKEKGLEFGVKLTNTFPVDVKQGELPSEEMYMAGRALFPLTIHLAARISETFGGALRISYSGGADIRNIAGLFRAGIWPITMATTILKPGGYQRMSQIAETLGDCGSEPFSGVDIQAVKALDEGVAGAGYYRKPIKPLPDRKTGRKLPLFDCFFAPCRDGCPIHQDIPAYLQAMLENDPEKALRIILERNPLPFITGTICPHHCGDKCMRNYYEESLRIRQTKLDAARQAIDRVLPGLWPGEPKSGKKVAVVGAGPAGLAAAMFLSRAGVPVTVFERKERPGGVVAHVIPDFRIGAEAIEKDIAICRAFGAEIVCGREIRSVAELKAEGYTDVIIAVGAWKHGRNPLKSGECLDALTFLEQLKTAPETLNLGENIVVLGGGNTAMDVARAARRLPGSPAVRLVYRRTRRYMPADEEELQMALEDGVEFMELLAPEKLENGQLVCHVMELGAPDASGRRSPVDTGEIRMVPADTVIAAVGERVDTSLFEAAGCELTEKGLPAVDAGMKTSAAGVYAIGDARRGPATVVEGIADAQAAAVEIAGVRFDGRESDNTDEEGKYLFKKGMIAEDNETPDWRCLGCPTVCAVCADVCPNRANVVIHVPGKCQAQILHVDGMCNECGNCAVFCPYSGKPYRDKFTLFGSEEDFENSENEGFLMIGEDRVKLRLDGNVRTVRVEEVEGISKDAAEMIRTVIGEYGYLIQN